MTLRDWRRATTVEINDYGQVGAGQVIDFNPRGTTEIVVHAEDRTEGLSSVNVCGDSLRDIGIADGDRLVCQTVFDRTELRNGRLVVAQLPCLGLVAKFFFRFDSKIVLRSANPRYEDLIFDEDLVEIKALVIQSIKSWD